MPQDEDLDRPCPSTSGPMTTCPLCRLEPGKNFVEAPQRSYSLRRVEAAERGHGRSTTAERSAVLGGRVLVKLLRARGAQGGRGEEAREAGRDGGWARPLQRERDRAGGVPGQAAADG